MPYLDLEAFKDATVMPATDVDALESVHPGWIDAQLALWSTWIDSRLSKRYAAPFAAPYPPTVCLWLSHLVTVRAYLKRGVNTADEQYGTIAKDAETAAAEIKEAADAEKGLFELPLRADTEASGVSRGAPMVYSETSPYVWTDRQGYTGHAQDRNGSGDHG